MTLSPRTILQAGAVGLVAALLGLLVWKVATPETRPDAGPAPAIEGPRLDRDGRLSLADFRGKGVVLNFWASWCEPCKQEASALEAAWREHRARGLVVLGVGEEDFSGDLRAFARKYRMSYPLLHDTSGKARGRYGLTGYPETFFVDRQGRLVAESVQGPVNSERNADRFAAGLRAALGP
jgi:cytochrome c biogenesis protein CcmG/thiol:disulfide interchange protein DsbE